MVLRAPVFRLVIPFAIGIILYDWEIVDRDWILLAGAVLIVAILLIRLLSSTWNRRSILMSGCLLMGLLTASGWLHSRIKDHRMYPEWIGRSNIDRKNHYLIQIREEASRTKTGWKITCDLIARSDSTQQQRVAGGVILHTKDDQLAKVATPGRKGWTLLKLRRIENKPGSSFDYARYHRMNKITHQGFISNESTVQWIDQTSGSIASQLHDVRIYVRTVLYGQLKDSLNSGLAAALLIGWKGGLDPELKQHYTRTGTIHIIAISGLHISLVFEILWRLLFPLLFIPGGKIIRTLITLTFIWAFCFLAGGEASVLRAGIMFTAVHLGRFLERPITGLQALGISVFTLLIADPDWIFDPGFQLSHSAVLGILLFQPLTFRIFNWNNPILKNIWESLSMTIAATIGTLPFTAYYFQQFPLLFVPANLIAVPLSSAALILLFILILVSPIPLLAKLIGYVLHVVLNGMSGWIERLDRIPGTVISW